jgi:hypothetical protein
MITREQQRSLLGMTPDQAKQRLKELGHTGSVQVVHDDRFVPNCGSNKVCDVNPGADMPLDDDITVTINPETHIAAPADE